MSLQEKAGQILPKKVVIGLAARISGKAGSGRLHPTMSSTQARRRNSMVFSASVTEDGSTHHEQHPNPGAALEPEGVLGFC